MGRRPRQSGYSQSNQPSRCILAKLPTRAPSGGVNRFSHDQIPSSANVQIVLQQNWGSSPEFTPNVHSTVWQTQTTTTAAAATNVDSLCFLAGQNLSLAPSPTTDTTLEHENSRTISPVINTPSGSTSSFHEFNHAQQLGQGIQNGEHLPLHGHSMTEDVIAGIDNRDPQDVASDFAKQPRPEFFISGQQQAANFSPDYRNTSPWDPLRSLRTSVSTMDVIMHDVSHPPQSTSGPGRGGGRKGPLTQLQKQQAGDVRRIRACLRCQITREKCDLKIPCNTCASKERRKFPHHCIRAKFSWEPRLLLYFPDELTNRLQPSRVFQEIQKTTFNMLSETMFIPLNMNIEDKWYVKVREFTPLGPPTLNAHRSVTDADGKKTYQKLDVWDPPIIMLIHSGGLEGVVNSTRVALGKFFVKVLESEESWVNWTMKYFLHDEENFQCDILGWVGKYYRKEIEEHAIIEQASTLLWFEYLLMNKFMINPEDATELEEKMESKRSENQKHLDAIPDKINMFLKAIILPMATAAAQRLTESLHDRLFKMAVSQKFGVADTDIVMCLLFILMIFIGEQQAAMLLLADLPDEQIGQYCDLETAKQKILEMEQEVVELWISFHKYTLSRTPTSGTGSSSSTAAATTTSSRSTSTLSDEEMRSAAEIHAREFDLVGQMKRQIKDEYVINRPTDLIVGGAATNNGFVLDGFRCLNIARLCWKVWSNIDGVNS